MLCLKITLLALAVAAGSGLKQPPPAGTGLKDDLYSPEPPTTNGAQVEMHKMSSSLHEMFRSIQNGTPIKEVLPSSPFFDCTKYPHMCRAPFNCHQLNMMQMLSTTVTVGMSANGHANPQSWCMSPEYQNYAHQCLSKKDLVQAGRTQFDETMTGKFGHDTAQLDGSYCFLDGHCTNPDVTEDTTLHVAELLCDDKYKNAWRTFGSLFAAPDDKMMSHMPKDPSRGFTSRTQTRPFLLAACAMGNYHCDVMYCKTTYCQNEHFVGQFGYLLEQEGWDNGDYVRNFYKNQPLKTPVQLHSQEKQEQKKNK